MTCRHRRGRDAAPASGGRVLDFRRRGTPPRRRRRNSCWSLCPAAGDRRRRWWRSRRGWSPGC